jgi:hypothetical protein
LPILIFFGVLFLGRGIQTAGSFIAGVCSSRLPLLVPGKLISYNYIHLWTVYPTELRNQRMKKPSFLVGVIVGYEYQQNKSIIMSHSEVNTSKGLILRCDIPVVYCSQCTIGERVFRHEHNKL